jgi:predicted O-methyltransferase YrrM
MIGLHVRHELPQWLVDNGFKKGVEIGVYKGAYTEMFCVAGVEMIYAVDPYIAYSEERSQLRQEFLCGYGQGVLSKYKNVTYVRKTSMEAVKDFADESLDFVYIDGNHAYKECKEDITEWAKKVRKGGVIAGHDYEGRSSKYVHQVVDEYIKEYNIPELEVIAKRGYMTEIGDKHASWLFFKT